MKFNTLNVIAKTVVNGSLDDVRKATRNALQGEGGDWAKYGKRFLQFLDTGKPTFSVYGEDGNSKLPFVAFSVLPGVTCPGAGECLQFCYSFRAWRYPAAFFRQAQNTVLALYRRETLRQEMATLLSRRKFAKQDRVDFRLYVDGDIDSMDTLEFWFSVLRDFPKLRAYGYSKSLELFTSYKGAMPDNYLLNLSSGSKYDDDAAMMNAAESLPFTRGRFVAIPIEGKFSAAKGDYKTKAYRDTVRTAMGGKPFVCPGRCGTCTPKGHACGLDTFRGIKIAIGIH